MSERARIIAIFGVVAVALGGGLFYYFKIHAPKEARGAAQAEVTAWEARWTEARTCLLGKTPASSKAGEALAVRELSPDPWERKTCTQLVSQLSRGEAEDTRVPAVEEAWRVLDKAASKVAISFVSHVDPGGDAMRKKPDPLPVALDELEAAYGGLRAAAELGPVKATSNGKPLPSAAIVPVTLDGKRILSLQEPYVTSRSGMLAFGTVDGAEVQFQFAAGKPPTLAAVAGGMQRAMPDGTWGARAIPDAIEVGQIDAKGAMAAPAQVALPGPTQVLAVVGTWADGVVVFGARCKAGACAPVEKKPYTVRSMAFASDAATGYTSLVWADDKSAMQVLNLDPSALETKVVPLDQPGFPKLMCLTNESTWLQYTNEGNVDTLELQKTGRASIPDDEHGLMGCSPGGAVLYKEFGDPSYRRCNAGKCDAVLTKSQKHHVPVAVVPAGIVGVETRGAVLAVRKGGPTDFYAVPNGLVPLVAMTDGNVIDVLAWTADGLVIARVSAR
jgi:hypothetical protein